MFLNFLICFLFNNVVDAADMIRTNMGDQGKPFSCISSVVQDNSKFMDDIPSNSLPTAWMLVIGSEHFGVSQEVRAISEECLMVRMAAGVDSLNANVAAAVLLNGLVEREIKA